MMYKIAVVLLVFVLAGCAGNGIKVLETTPDGGTLAVTQSTFSTLGARTKEGAGDFTYTGTSPDGSSFDMRAGAAVSGQSSPDPTAAILGVVNTLAPIMSQKIVADSQQVQPSEPSQSDQRIERLEKLVEDLILQWSTRF